jgi:hypothetical protein
MAKKALILNNTVVDVTETEFEVHSSLTWMDCSDSCVAGWTLVDGILTAPAAEPEWSYDRKRRNEYPDFREYLDGIVKGDNTQIDTYKAACQAVKDKYPKE